MNVKYLFLSFLIPLIAQAEAPVVFSGSTAKWLPSGLKTDGVCQLNASGVMSSSALSLAGTRVTGTLPINKGGTGQTTANDALNALLPSQTGNAGEFLTTDGTNASWASAGGSSGWSLTGNAGTTAGTNFIGTTDGVDFVVKTSNTERFRVTSSGSYDSNLGLGIIHSDASGIWSATSLDLSGSYVTGVLPVPSGGTGQSSLTDGAVVVGNGTSAVTLVGPGATGTVLKGNTGAAPVFGQVTNSDMANMADGTIKSNISGGAAAPSDNTLDAILDDYFGTAQGTVIYRGASNWAGLAPGTNGHFLQTQGAGANPQWAAASGGSSTLTQSKKTANYTLTNSDDVIYCNSGTANISITLHSASTATSKEYRIKNINTKPCYIVPAGGDLLMGSNTSLELAPGSTSLDGPAIGIIPDGGSLWSIF